jgi:protein-L-isoaspartate(D-aspartate) O-methyltransferase
MCTEILVWDRDRTARPIITAYPADTPDAQLIGARVIDKQHSRLTIAF